MAADEARRRAPDLFSALEIETRTTPPISDDGVPVELADDASNDATQRLNSSRPPPAPPSTVATGRALAGLAATLGPEPVDTSDTTVAASVPIAFELDADPVQRTGGAAGWIALTLLFAGGLGYVLYAETDLFDRAVQEPSGPTPFEARADDVPLPVAGVAKRSTGEYGTVRIGSEPDGARVFLLETGPEARFRNLPRTREYQVLLTAPGHAPRVELIGAADLVAPVVMDLEPTTVAEGVLPIPPAAPPQIDPEPESKDTVDLVLRTSTPDARFGLLIGYTPGVTVVDLDVARSHVFLVTKEGYEPRELVIKGRHWEEEPGGSLVYVDHVQLVAIGSDRTSAEPESAHPGTEENARVTQTVTRQKRKKRRKRRR